MEPGTRNRKVQSSGIVEVAPVFVRDAGQKLEERIEAAIERAAQLWNRAVDRVQRQSGCFAVFQAQPSLFGADERAFRDEPDTVDKRIARHNPHKLSRAVPVYPDDDREQRGADCVHRQSWHEEKNRPHAGDDTLGG